MNKYLKLSLIGLLVVVIAGVSVIGVAYAQDDDPPHPHEALAELLGLTEDELRDLMHNGSTLQDLADEAGVDIVQILDFFLRNLPTKIYFFAFPYRREINQTIN